ncbi:arsenate reductase (glutaredoxin) [Rhodobacteraceae bacterium M385]|nr:arsenate reductase (glutaredoxin) [Rhodobacteraceae bacterium M385]
MDVTPPFTLWHNPRCSKSRAALAHLQAAGIEPTLRLYLKEPPSEAEITDLLSKLSLSPRDMMRRGESIYKDQNLKAADDATLIKAMVQHPILIERPILSTPTSAKIGRPTEALDTLL